MSRKILPSEFARSAIRIKGKNLKFDLYLPFKDVYDWPKKRFLLKTGRQVGKSTFLSGFALTKSMRTRYHRTFYASTSERQAREFARVKLNEIMYGSPIVKNLLLNKKDGEVNDSVLEKQFSNGSGIVISFMKDDADRTRGYSADTLMMDEVQDMLPEQLDVVEEILSASLEPERFYTGTPKTIDNHIETKWQQSTMNEVFFQCNSCRKYNSIGYRNIGKNGPICSKCGGSLDMVKYEWVSTRSKDQKDAIYIGARVPQPALVLHTGFEEKWKDILIKYEKDSTIFFNETLGISHSSGKRTITQDMIIECCTGPKKLEFPTDNTFRMYGNIFMGIDWSGDGESEISKNAMVIFGIRNGDPSWKPRVLFSKIFPRQDFMKTINEIVMYANAFKVKYIGADAGGGALNNSFLADRLGANRVQPFRYGSFSYPVASSKDNRTINIDKTSAIDDFMKMIINKGIEFPNFDDFKEETEHILSNYEITRESGKKIWTNGKVKPDDILHALVFGIFAMKVFSKSLKFY